MQSTDLFNETKLYDRQGLDIHVTTRERTLVDCLDKPQFAGGWEEIYHAAEMVDFLDVERIVRYALLLNNLTTIAKVGFFLEQHQSQWAVSEKYLTILENNKPNGIHHLLRSADHRCQYFKRWNIMVPLFIVNKIWEEPDL